MLKQDPLPGEYYVLKAKDHSHTVFKVIQTSRGSDEVYLLPLDDNHAMVVRFGTFRRLFQRVFKVGAVAKLLERSPRSIYRYERAGLIGKPKRYPDMYGREIRFYTKKDVMDMHEMISDIHAGRPRKDQKIINNSLKPRAELLIELRERFGE